MARIYNERPLPRDDYRTNALICQMGVYLSYDVFQGLPELGIARVKFGRQIVAICVNDMIKYTNWMQNERQPFYKYCSRLPGNADISFVI